MAAKGYTTKTEIQNYLLTAIDASFDSQVDSWISQVEQYIDQQTGKNFIAPSLATEKVYDGDGSNEIEIDDCVEITKLEICDTEGNVIEDSLVKSQDYFYLPENQIPIQALKLYGYRFQKGIQNIKVTGKWGFSTAVPNDIKFAATILAANIINFSNQVPGELKLMMFG